MGMAAVSGEIDHSLNINVPALDRLYTAETIFPTSLISVPAANSA